MFLNSSWQDNPSQMGIALRFERQKSFGSLFQKKMNTFKIIGLSTWKWIDGKLLSCNFFATMKRNKINNTAKQYYYCVIWL
jgi:hypothetical protein